MTWCKWVVGLLGVATAAGCAHAPKQADDANRRLAYVDEVRAPATVGLGERVNVVVVGAMPDPSWELGEVLVEQRDHRVHVLPWLVKKHDKPTMQMLVPFERTVPVDGLTAGTWTVEVQGYDGANQSVSVDVKP